MSTVLCTSSYRVQFLYTISPAQSTVCLNSPPVSVDITCGHRPLVCGHFAQPPLNCTILHAIALHCISSLFCIAFHCITLKLHVQSITFLVCGHFRQTRFYRLFYHIIVVFAFFPHQHQHQHQHRKQQQHQHQQ